VHNMLLWHTRC